MSRKIARITQDKKLLLANEVVEDNTKIRLNSDGRLDTDEIIEYPDELEGGRNFFSFNDFNINKFETSYRFAYFYYLQLEPNTKYTASTNDINGKDTTFANVYIYPSKWTGIPNTVNYGVYKGRQKTVISDNEGYVTLVVKHTNNGTDGGSDGLIYEKLQTGETWLQLTKGNKATDWTPAPEDLGLNYPDSIQNFNSSISGNNIIAPELIEGYPFVKPVIDDSLVLWLDGSTGNNYEQTGTWKDLSGNGNDGELVNFGYIEDSGWADGGLKFDGVDDYVDISPDFDFGTDSFTIEIMSKHYDYKYPLTNFAIRNNKLAFLEGEKGFQIGHGYHSDGVDVVVNDGTNLIRGNIGKTPELNKKVHAIFVFDRKNGNVLYFYDGELVGELDISEITGDIKHSNLIHIGNIAGWKPNMSLYSFRLYNRALTDEEIMQNYQAGQCSPLLAMRGDV